MKRFQSFRLDTANQCLWDGDVRVALTPKAFDVLRYLVEHAGRLVTANEILQALWPATYINPEGLRKYVLEIRRVLGDRPDTPQFIETLPKRGYQFVASVTDESAAAALPAEGTRKIVGRESELAELGGYLSRAQRSERQIVFVTGDPGIGKTALVDEFQRQTAAKFPGILIARGQCVEGYGSKEAYYPMFEALGQLCHGPEGDSVVQILATQAPSWLVQFPAFVKPKQREMLQREIQGATRERMLREISEALETIASGSPLLLVFSDLHWVDPSTVDLISALARRRAPAKLMLISTYRPVDVTLAQHPLKGVKQDLLIHHLCHEIALQPLEEADVAEYVAAESGGAEVPKGLAGLIYRHTEGNPLYMVAALDDMRDRGLIVLENGAWQLKVPLEKIDLQAPESLRQMIELQIERLSEEEQRLLEVASVLRKFSLSVTIGAAVSNLEPDRVEEVLERLARRHQMIRAAGFRDYRTGTSLCYEFVHVLYREVLYRRIGPARKRKLHQSVAEKAEALHVLSEADAAAELAYQFEEGGDWPRAIKHLRSAADTAGRRFEPRQAAAILEHTLELVSRLPEAERATSEIELWEKLAAIYTNLFDQRAVATYEALASRAAHYGRADVEARALPEMVLPIAQFSGVDHYMQTLERARDALSRSGEGDTLHRAAMRVILKPRDRANDWEPEDLQEFKGLVAKVRESGDQRLLRELLHWSCYVLINSSEYREAYGNAEESLAIALECCEENPYLGWDFTSYEHLIVKCLFLLGEWGEALRRNRQRAEVAKKNGNRENAAITEMERAWILIEAMDFAGSQQIIESALPLLAAIPLPHRTCLILAGWAEAGLGNHERALEHLLTCRKEMDQLPMLADWHFRLTLQRALTEAWLSKGDLGKARAEAEEFLKITLTVQDRMARALAFEANARLAIAEQDFDRAQDFIARALKTMEGYEVPLAHWRVHATAAEFYQNSSDWDLAERHLELSRDTIMKLANSLPAEEPLRQTFLSAPMIRPILDNPKTAVRRAKRA